MSFKPLWAGLALATATVAAPLAQAQALPITGGTTAVKLTAAPTLVGAGVAVGVLGSASFSPGSTPDGLPLVYFPVTGGAIDTGSFAGTVQHAGSGLSLSRSGATINLQDFVIDTAGLQLSGDVSFGTTSLADVPLFAIGLSGNPFLPFTLSLTAAAGGALATVLGIPDLTGATIALANTVPITAAVVPEPATYAMLLAGLALVGVFGSRKRQAALPA